MRLPLPSKLLLSDIEIIKKQIFYSCPFELPAKQHRPVSPSWPNGRCCLAGNSKGHRRISKIFLSLFLYTWVDQNIFFPEIYNAPIISELGFTVWYKAYLEWSKTLKVVFAAISGVECGNELDFFSEGDGLRLVSQVNGRQFFLRLSKLPKVMATDCDSIQNNSWE